MSGINDSVMLRCNVINEWWKHFRYIKKEEAIKVILTTRTRLHPYDWRDDEEGFRQYVLPILYTRKLWDKAHKNTKRAVYKCIIEARVDLIEQKLAKVPTLDEIQSKMIARM